MRLPLVCLGQIALCALVLGSHPALAGTAPDSRFETAIKVLDDLSRPDEIRIRARNTLRSAFLLNAGPLTQRLIKLGQETQTDNVRMHVAILFAQAREATKVVGPALPMLTAWLEKEDGDAALRYWSARAIARAETSAALTVLKTKALASGQSVWIKSAVVRDIAQWPKPLVQKEGVPLLLSLLKQTEKPAAVAPAKPDADPMVAEARRRTDRDRLTLRVAVVDALQRTGINASLVIEPLIKLARDDTEEAVWRAAADALRRVGGGTLNIPSPVSDKERKEKISNWANVWHSKRRREERTGG